MVFVSLINSQSSILKIYYNEKDCYQCNQYLEEIYKISSNFSTVNIYVKEEIKGFENDIFTIDKKLTQKIKFVYVDNNFFQCKLSSCKYPVISSYVILIYENEKDSFPLKEISNYLSKLKKMRSNNSQIFMNPENYENFNYKLKNNDEIPLKDSIKIFDISFAYYANNKISIPDKLINKIHIIEFNDKAVQFFSYSLKSLNNSMILKCNCFDTVLYKKNIKEYFDIPHLQTELTFSFHDSITSYFAFRFPYFETSNLKDTVNVKIINKSFIMEIKNNTLNQIFCIKESGPKLINNAYLLNSHGAFFVKNNILYTSLFKYKEFENEAFLAELIPDKLSFQYKLSKIIYGKENYFNKVLKTPLSSNVNNGIYYFVKDFLFYDYVRNKSYFIKKETLNIKNSDTLFIDACEIKENHLNIIYTIFKNKNYKRNFVKLDLDKNKIINHYVIEDSNFYEDKSARIFFMENKNKILYLTKEKVKFIPFQR